ncbi:MAG: hypothetical protein R3E90_02715 [Marinicella sp.]
MQYDFEPLIPEGNYPVVYFRHRFDQKFGRPVMLLQFTIAELTQYQNAVLTKYFPIKSYNRKGGFAVSKKQDFALFWYQQFPDFSFQRFDRFPMTRLEGLIMQAKIITPKKNHKHEFIPEPLRISKIEKLTPL